ncbi:MAG: TonB-dependent hemoglobin/transferrin/lactoferrin family receptor [Rickettsiales bacterium]|nr:TonB-dependent hemoglobin/transferrin/lactoferrin family receptor [Rickettsiales bacterium]
MTNKLNKIFLLSASIFIASSASDALARTPKDKGFSLDTVTVVATKNKRDIKEVPNMVSVVDATQEGLNLSTNISDLTRNVTGLNFVGGPVRSGQTPNMRGFDSTSLLITQDGRRLNFESVHDGRFFVDPSMLKRVEVVKGPSSASYGSGGVGGVIAFETKSGKDFAREGQTEGVEFRTGYQSVNEEGNGGLTTFKIGDNYDAVASLTHRRSEDIELSNDTTQRSDDNLLSGVAKLTYNLSDVSSLVASVQSFMNNATENTNPQAGTVQNSGKNLVDKDITQNEVGIKFLHNPNELVNLKTHFYVVDTGVEERIIEGTALTAVNDTLNREMVTYGLNIENNSKIGFNSFTYGIELFQNVQEGSFTNSNNNSGLTGNQRPGVPNAEQLVFGGFLQDELNFDLGGEKELFVVPAARFDVFRNSTELAGQPSTDDQAFTPRLGATYKHNDNFSVFSNYSTGYRTPNLTELYAAGAHFRVGAYTNTFLPNSNLKPEESETFEYGLNLNFKDVVETSDELNFRASRYETTATNYIEQVIFGSTIGIPFVCPFPFTAGGCSAGNTQLRNIAEAQIWGYEADVTYESDLVRAQLGASFNNGKNSQNGQFLTTKQPFLVNSDIGFKLPYDLVAGHYGKYAMANERALVDVPNQINYLRSGFAVHGVYLSYNPTKLDNLSLDMGIDNMFDKRYKDPFFELYSPGRNYRAGLTWRF